MVTANQHRHDLSAAFTRTNLQLACFKKGARLQHFTNTYRVRGGEAWRWVVKADWGKCFHYIVATQNIRLHLQRDPAKFCKAGEG